MLKAEELQPADANFEKFLNFVQSYRSLERIAFVERAGFNEEQVEEYETCFNKYDHDGGGSLSLKEINPLLEELGKAPKNKKERERLLEMIKEIDDDDTGEIEFK